MARVEVDAIPDRKRRRRVGLLLPEKSAMVKVTEAIIARGIELAALGFKPADATHVAAAEFASVDVLLSRDDRFCRIARRAGKSVIIRVANPVDWLREVGYGQVT